MSIDHIVIILISRIWESASSLEAFTPIMANSRIQIQSIHSKKVVVEVGQEWSRPELENRVQKNLCY